MDKRISMDETFVFLRKGSERRGSKGTIDPEDVLCTLPKPTFNCLFVTTVIQSIIIIIIIISGCIAFGPLGYQTCSLIVPCHCTEADKMSETGTDPSKGFTDANPGYTESKNILESRINSGSRIKGNIKYYCCVSCYHLKP